jgi:hypothetical protein
MFIVAASLLGSPLAVSADDECPVRLEWKAFDPAHTQTFYQTVTTNVKQSMKLMGMTVEQVQNQTFYIQWIPQPKDKNGNWIALQKIIGVKMDIDIGGNKVSYDSTGRTIPQGPLLGLFQALVTADLVIRINPRTMALETIESNEDLIKKLSDANPQMKELLRSVLSEASFKQMSEPAFPALPAKPVRPGDTWKRTTLLELGPIGGYRTHYHFRYVAREDHREKIAVAVRMEYVPPFPVVNGLPFKIEKTSTLIGTGAGYAFFNPQRGWFDSYNVTTTLKGTLDLDIGGMKTQAELTQEQAASVATTIYHPLAGPPQKEGKIETQPREPRQPQECHPRCDRQRRCGLFPLFRRCRCHH